MQTQDPTDAVQSIDLDPQLAVKAVDRWLDSFVELLPNIVVAVIVFGLFYILAIIARKAVTAAASVRGRDNLGANLGSFAKAVVVVLGFLMALTIVVPSIKLGDVVASLGFGSVALGFAFKDILQNWLAGMLLLFRQPFEIGDQIEVKGFVGTVETIDTRATLLKTFDAERIVIPNSDIYTSAVRVKTAFALRRSEYDVGIGYGDDIETARAAILEALAGIEGLQEEPAPEAYAWDLAASWVTLRVRWWTDSSRADITRVRAKAIQAMKEALDAAGVDMPFDTNVLLVHDQTEAEDGDRSAQREGWPLGDRPQTLPRWRAAAGENAASGAPAGR